MLMHNPPHPGKLLRRLYMQPLGLTVSALAHALKVSRGTMSQLVNGRSRMTPNLALRLSQAFSNGPEGWLNMQQQFDLWHETHKLRHVRISTIGNRQRKPA